MEPKPWHRHYDYNVPTTVREPRLPIHELIQVSANACPDHAALNFHGTEITFWELRLLIIRFANALGGLGVRQGERVGIHLPNCPQYPIAYYAVLSLGAVVVNLNPMYTAEEIKLVVSTTGLTTLITFDMVLPAIRALDKEVHIPRVIVTKVTDFIKGVSSAALPKTSYFPGVTASPLHEWLPDTICRSLRNGFLLFGSIMKGFVTDEAVILGVESRTSSPVRIPRKSDTLEHIKITGLYPCGEGSGYAGGIVSSAVDGMRVAEAVVYKIRSRI